jgi:hypothetical protein
VTALVVSVPAGSTKPKLQKEIAMSGRMLVTFAALVFWLIPAAAPAAPFFPLQLGAYSQFDGSDLSGHTWQASIWVVAEGIKLNSQTYFHIRRQNWNPYGWEPLGPQDFLMRSTEVDAFMSLGGPEWRQFSVTPENWRYDDPPGQTECYTQVEVTGPMEITVPYGYFPQAYQDKGTFNDPVKQYNPWYAYLAPGLGLIKEVQTNVPSESTTMTQVLSQTGTMGVSLFPMMTGYTWTYNGRDKLGNTWQMQMQTLGQVSFGGNTYFRMRQINYYPFGENPKREFYMRCSANQAWISYDGMTEYLAFQVARQGTQWNYPDPWDRGTDYIFIDFIEPINVLGGSLLAYPHDGTFVGEGGKNGFWIDYIVPAVGLVRRDDYNLPGPDRAPLIFELVKMEQVGSANPGNPGNPGVLLLLLE